MACVVSAADVGEDNIMETIVFSEILIEVWMLFTIASVGITIVCHIGRWANATKYTKKLSYKSEVITVWVIVNMFIYLVYEASKYRWIW